NTATLSPVHGTSVSWPPSNLVYTIGEPGPSANAVLAPPTWIRIETTKNTVPLSVAVARRIFRNPRSPTCLGLSVLSGQLSCISIDLLTGNGDGRSKSVAAPGRNPEALE